MMLRTTIMLVTGMMLVVLASTLAQQFTSQLELILSTDKKVYTLGEPIVVTVQLRNVSDTPQTLIYRLGPEFGLLNYSLSGPGREQTSFQPFSHVNVRRSFRDELPPQASFYETVKLFYANTGWTFRKTGKYTVTVAYPGVDTPLTAELEIDVAEPPSDGQAAAEKMLSNNQQGLLLYWEHGDQLTEGIRNMTSIAQEFPDSPLAAYANYGIGINLSKEFYNAAKDEVRPADFTAAIEHLNKALDAQMDSYFRVQASLALAESYIGVQDFGNARELLTRFIEEFKNDPRYQKQVARARELLSKLP